MLDDSPGLGGMADGDHARAGTGWDDFCSARERFLARLAALSEISRLERAWALEAPSERGRRIARPGPGTGPPAPERRGSRS